jgi:hypothetical protein
VIRVYPLPPQLFPSRRLDQLYAPMHAQGVDMCYAAAEVATLSVETRISSELSIESGRPDDQQRTPLVSLIVVTCKNASLEKGNATTTG